MSHDGHDDTDEPGATRASTETWPTSSGKPRVLVVDDNAANRLVAGRMLKMIGCEVVLANDGSEAVHLADAEQFDVIFMDRHMPVLDGDAAARQIRAEATGRPVPIIAMTASVMEADRQAATDAGMDDFLAKPISLDDLRSAVERWVVPTDDQGKSLVAEQQSGAEPMAKDVLDPARLAELRQYYPHDRLPALLQTFRRQGRHLLDQAVQAHAAGDMKRLQGAVHSLRGSSASLGAVRLSQLAGATENAATAANPHLAELVRDLQREWSVALDALSGVVLQPG